MASVAENNATGRERISESLSEMLSEWQALASTSFCAWLTPTI
jgi:hypothetical protein